MLVASEGHDTMWLRHKGSLGWVARENLRMATPEETVGGHHIQEALEAFARELVGTHRNHEYQEVPRPEATAAGAGEELATAAAERVESDEELEEEPAANERGQQDKEWDDLLTDCAA